MHELTVEFAARFGEHFASQVYSALLDEQEVLVSRQQYTAALQAPSADPQMKPPLAYLCAWQNTIIKKNTPIFKSPAGLKLRLLDPSAPVLP